MNKIVLLGRLTKDVESKTIGDKNTTVANFGLAVAKKFKQDGEKDADFFNVVVFGKTAEFCGKYFAKGQQIALTGRLQNRSWDDKDGKKCYITEVVAEEVFFADSKKEGQAKTNDGFNPIDDSDEELPF